MNWTDTQIMQSVDIHCLRQGLDLSRRQWLDHQRQLWCPECVQPVAILTKASEPAADAALPRRSRWREWIASVLHITILAGGIYDALLFASWLRGAR